MRFRSVIRLGGKTATGIPVPVAVVESLGQGRRPPVRVTINGYTYRTTVATRAGEFLLSVSAEVRDNAGVAAGDEVDVDIALDTEPRRVTVPPDLAEALAGDAEAKRFFDSLAYTQQRWYVTWLEAARKPETRQRRIAEALGMLREGRTQR